MLNKNTQQATLLPWLMCGLGAIYYCYEYFLRISPSVMTPELMRAYHLDGGQVGSLAAFYYHAYVPMQIVVGLLLDRYGPRRLLTIACLLCAVGTYFFACSTSVVVAQVGRFMVGFGSAFAFVGAIKLATIWLPPNRFALLSGLIMCLGMVGGMAGDFLLRGMVDAMGWKATMYVSAGAGVVLAGVLWSVIRDTNSSAYYQHNDVMCFRDLFIGLFKIVKNPQIWINGVVGLMLYLALSVFAELWGISYLEQARGLSKMTAAGANSMIFLGWAIGAPFWGWLSDLIGKRCAPIRWSSVAALVFISIVLYVPGLPVALLYILLFGFGVMTSTQMLAFAICHEMCSLRITATAVALTNMIVMVGGNIFQPVVGKLLDLFWTGQVVEGARVYSSFAYQVALSVLPLCLVLTFILMGFLRETYGQFEASQGAHPKA